MLPVPPSVWSMKPWVPVGEVKANIREKGLCWPLSSVSTMCVALLCGAPHQGELGVLTILVGRGVPESEPVAPAHSRRLNLGM